MAARSALKAWVVLVVLSLCTTMLSVAEASQSQHRILIAGSFLALAGVKGRVILADYLGLRTSRFWTKAFDLTLGLFLVIAFAIYSFAARP